MHPVASSDNILYCPVELDTITGVEELVDTKFEGAPVKIYSVSCEHNGKIYGVDLGAA